MDSASHHNQQHQSGLDDWHLQKLLQSAKRRGFDNYSDDNSIHLYLKGDQGIITLAHNFPRTREGALAALAWIDNQTSILHQPQTARSEQTTQTLDPYTAGLAAGLTSSNQQQTPTQAIAQPTTKGSRTPTVVITIIVMVVLFIGLGIWYNNTNYNSTFETNFMNSCESNGSASAAACGCSYNVLKANYSYSQAKYFDSNLQAPDTQTAFTWIANQCK
jgi:hypothetical protein